MTIWGCHKEGARASPDTRNSLHSAATFLSPSHLGSAPAYANCKAHYSPLDMERGPQSQQGRTACQPTLLFGLSAFSVISIIELAQEDRGHSLKVCNPWSKAAKKKKIHCISLSLFPHCAGIPQANPKPSLHTFWDEPLFLQLSAGPRPHMFERDDCLSLGEHFAPVEVQSHSRAAEGKV